MIQCIEKLLSKNLYIKTRDSWLPIWRKNSSVGQQISRFLLCFLSFWPLFYSYGQFYFFKTPKRQEIVAFLGLFCLIWISCKNIELFQNRKSNLFPDFFLDLGNPANNLEAQEMNLGNSTSNPIDEADYNPAGNLEVQEMKLVSLIFCTHCGLILFDIQQDSV